MTDYKEALNWAYTQKDYNGNKINKNSERFVLIDKVREYFNQNNISYDRFSYKNLKPYL